MICNTSANSVLVFDNSRILLKGHKRDYADVCLSSLSREGSTMYNSRVFLLSVLSASTGIVSGSWCQISDAPVEIHGLDLTYSSDGQFISTTLKEHVPQSLDTDTIKLQIDRTIDPSVSFGMFSKPNKGVESTTGKCQECQGGVANARVFNGARGQAVCSKLSQFAVVLTKRLIRLGQRFSRISALGYSGSSTTGPELGDEVGNVEGTYQARIGVLPAFLIYIGTWKLS